MWLKSLLIYLAFSSVLAKINLNPLEEDTLVPISGRVCGYGDMNKDQYTDIIVFESNSLFIMFQPTSGLKFAEDPHFERIQLRDPGWVYCAVADFNGDSLPDIMVTIDNTDGSSYNSIIYIQRNSSPTEKATFEPKPLSTIFLEQPSVMDVNGDGKGDIIGFDKDKNFVCIKIEGKDNVFENCTDLFSYFNDLERQPYADFSPIFTDINGDLSAEIIFGFNLGDDKLTLEVFQLSEYSQALKWEYSNELSRQIKLPTNLPFDLKYLGSPVVADFDADGNIEILIPVCQDRDYKKVTTILMWTSKHGWVHFPLDLKEYDISRHRKDFIFRVGDFSLDGFPDLIVTVSSGNNVLPMILENVEYPDNANFSRKFELKSRFIMPTEMSQGVNMAAFFDLKEDGNLDILVEYRHEGILKFDFIKCDDKGDTTFLKVQIFTNACDLCLKSDGKKEYQRGSGITWHGACSMYSTTDYLGQTRLSTQCQIPQTSHRALYSPYVLFGLGRSPNFIDEVKFGVPQQVDPYGYQRHSTPQIVPNSRIIAIPPKYGSHNSWQIRLYLTPSSLIIQSLFVLLTVCGILSLVVIILHIREKHADKKERQAQSHRFHFDAM